MDGLRSIIDINSHSAMDVGQLREGTRHIQGSKAEFQGRTRGEEVDTVGRWPPLVDADWHAFCQAIYKGIGGSERSELYEQELRRRVKVKKRKPFGQ